MKTSPRDTCLYTRSPLVSSCGNWSLWVARGSLSLIIASSAHFLRARHAVGVVSCRWWMAACCWRWPLRIHWKPGTDNKEALSTTCRRTSPNSVPFYQQKAFSDRKNIWHLERYMCELTTASISGLDVQAEARLSWIFVQCGASRVRVVDNVFIARSTPRVVTSSGNIQWICWMHASILHVTLTTACLFLGDIWVFLLCMVYMWINVDSGRSRELWTPLIFHVMYCSVDGQRLRTTVYGPALSSFWSLTLY